MIEKHEIAAMMKSVAGVVKAHVAGAVGVLTKSVDARIAILESNIKDIPAGPKGDKGDAGESIRGEKGDAGKDTVIDPVLLRAIVSEEASRAVADIPKPERGEPGPPGKDGGPGEKGVDGRDAAVDYDRIGAAIRDVVAVAVAEIPKPKDADPAAIEASVAAAVSKANLEFYDMADELLHGLEGEANASGAHSQSPNVTVHVNVPINELSIARVQAHVPGMREMGDAFSKLDRTLKSPMRPVYDEKGKLIGGERVESL